VNVCLLTDISEAIKAKRRKGSLPNYLLGEKNRSSEIGFSREEMKSGTKIAVITGSAGGLGKEFAEKLLESGNYQVCLSDVNESLGKETCQSFSEKYGKENVHFVSCDVRSMESVDQLWCEATSHFQTSTCVDLWVNNAGVMGEKEGWRLCLDINLMGVLNGIDVMSRKSPEQCSVTVVNVASILGLFNVQQPKGWAYNVSKSAVVNATRCMATSWKNIRMLCICPSVTLTPILDGCTKEEVKEMGQQVGGLMTPNEVGKAFKTLLKDGKSGDVMTLWKDCPPYFIPDTTMGIFIAFTTGAMMFRFVPFFKPNSIRPWPHMFICFLIMIGGMIILSNQLTNLIFQ